VEGPADLEVLPLQLEAARAGWKHRASASSWQVAAGRLAWTQTLELVQTQPGVVPLPGVRVRIRQPGQGWQEVFWVEPLGSPHDELQPEGVPELPSSSFPWFWPALAVFLTAGLVSWLWWRRRPVRAPVDPLTQALARLDATNLSHLPTDECHAVLSAVMRALLAERLGAGLEGRTTQEGLGVVTATKKLTTGTAEEVREVLGQCDEVKFAGVASGAEVIEQRLERGRRLVRSVVEQTGQVRQGEGSSPAAQAG